MFYSKQSIYPTSPYILVKNETVKQLICKKTDEHVPNKHFDKQLQNLLIILYLTTLFENLFVGTVDT